MGLGTWIKDRWPISAILYWGLHEEIPGGSRFAYVLGSSTFFLFVIQALTGFWQLFYYVPTVDHAYASVSYLRLEVPFGWLIHSIHYWGATAFLIVMGLHALRTFIWGAYKKPRELTWLLGVALLILGAMLMFTGAVLPWDLMGYWAGQVGVSIAGTVPIIGNFLKTVMLGGNDMGQLALMRFFVLHVGILPALTALIILAHIVAFRQFGSVGPWKEKRRVRIGHFWPDQTFKDLLIIAAIFLLLIGLSAFFSAPFPGPADPLDQTYSPKPEWNFLFLYQALRVFKGTLEPVGTVLLPLILVILLVIPPFLDRRDDRNPLRRPLAMICGFLFAAGIFSLTIYGLIQKPSTAGETEPSAAVSPAAPASLPAAAVARGRTIFVGHGCSACHSTTGEAGLGPDLSGEGLKGRTKDWFTTQIRNPASHNPETVMPAYVKLSGSEVDDVITYLTSLRGAPASQPTIAKASTGPTTGSAQTPATPQPPVASQPGEPGPAARMIGNADHGQVLYGEYCMYCHGKAGRGESPIPALKPINPRLYSSDPLSFAQQVDRIVQHGQKPPPGTRGQPMPNFGDSKALTQPQIANIEAYVMRLNGVDRSQILSPGVEPHRFFYISAGVFVLAGLLLSGLWLTTRSRGAPPA